jgi:hypothetical protein
MRALGLSLLLVWACGSPGTGPAAPPAPEKPIAFIVAGQSGVVEMGSDGAVKRTLSPTPARTVRRMPDGALVFLTADLREVRLLAPAETVLAVLPDALPPCEPPPKTRKRKTWRQLPIPLVELDLMRADDFAVADGGKAVCLQLRDRRGEEARIQLGVRIDRAPRQVAMGYAMPERCAQPAPPCAAAASVTREAPHPPPPSGYVWESTSASRRWTLLSANGTTGEFATRDLFLRDEEQKAVYPLRTGAWPPPMGQTLPYEMNGATLDAITGTELRWLDPDDLLLVDTVLIVPGQRVVELPGDVAR